ncbi:hypothetical protein [Paraflavitalea speifideaquila]|nr:hypothetical protein [Paraflavitalea speifideiaquila]
MASGKMGTSVFITKGSVYRNTYATTGMVYNINTFIQYPEMNGPI